MEKILKNQFFHLLIKITGICVIIFSISMLIINFTYGDQMHVKGLNKQLGSLGEYGTIVAASLWFLRHIWLFLYRNKLHGFKVMKEFYILVKKFHTLIGYAILSVAITHGVYFFIKGSHHVIQIYSGIFAFICLTLLGFVGILLHKSNNKKKFIVYRKTHQIAAVLFGIGLLIHLMV